ncbi:polysaccharide pyruvyl transferase family protein [Jatrophihabitans sp.]|uniref:polysaccharide pyruvyl transferase family protein n=1 Tax=Jatrophihabitans sp. TaxID=1932789 RepID=UPI0030C73420|nr:putative polysaccharide biosynthesis protein [Jatrophihabitans sp.]
MSPVEIVNWNPRRSTRGGALGKVSQRIGLAPRVNNFGDLLGPLIVRELLRRRGIDPRAGTRDVALLSVGSVLRLATEGDVVWGTGANGKSLDETFRFTQLDVRAVRGPHTRDFLQGRGITVPEVYGDPGLLVGTLWSRDELRGSEPTHPLTVIPNLNDAAQQPDGPGVISPQLPLATVLRRIAASEFVTGSSLHAVVIADALGIPARLIESGHEPRFKYEDYYLGSGREGYTPAPDAATALALGGEPAPVWDPAPLLAAFPYDLWGAE